MHFSQDLIGGVNLIRAYSAGELRVNETVVRRTVIVGATCLSILDDVENVHDLSAKHAISVLAKQAEIVLIGSGVRQEFPPREFLAEFVKGQIGIEVMSTPAACRTYNVLISERRTAIALLVP